MLGVSDTMSGGKIIYSLGCGRVMSVGLLRFQS
jgi:hypothetical protein